MEEPKKIKKPLNRPPNPQALAELYDRMIYFFAMREMEQNKRPKRFHWVGSRAPKMENSQKQVSK